MATAISQDLPFDLKTTTPKPPAKGALTASVNGPPRISQATHLRALDASSTHDAQDGLQPGGEPTSDYKAQTASRTPDLIPQPSRPPPNDIQNQADARITETSSSISPHPVGTSQRPEPHLQENSRRSGVHFLRPLQQFSRTGAHEQHSLPPPSIAPQRARLGGASHNQPIRHGGRRLGGYWTSSAAPSQSSTEAWQRPPSQNKSWEPPCQLRQRALNWITSNRLAVVAAIIVGAIGLRWAYDQKRDAHSGLILQIWTAKKDLWEACRALEDAGKVISDNCAHVLEVGLPDAPFPTGSTSKRLLKRVQDVLSSAPRHGASPTTLWDRKQLSKIVVLAAIVSFIAATSFIFCCLRALRTSHDSPIGNAKSIDATRQEGTLAQPATRASSAWMPSVVGHLRRRRGNTLHAKRKSIWDAAADGDTLFIQQLLSQGTDINGVSRDRGTALTTACQSQQFEIAKLLLDRGADVNVQGGRYGTALYISASTGANEIVRMLLDAGADVNLGKRDSETPLLAAALQGYDMTVQMLLNRGADPNIASEDPAAAGADPLHAAIWEGKESTVRLLLSRDARVDMQSDYCRKAFHTAFTKGHRGIIDVLLAHAAIETEVSGLLAKFHRAEKEGPEQAWAFLKAQMELLQIYQTSAKKKD